MPIKVPSSLLFPSSGMRRPLDREVVDELLALVRRIQNPEGYKSTLETFKKHFARALGESWTPSSSSSWAETDLVTLAETLSANAPGFIASFCNACEELWSRRAAVPFHEDVNRVLATLSCPYRIENGELVAGDQEALAVDSPVPPIAPGDTVARALADAATLVGSSGAASAVDRLHTALHGYLAHLCAAQSLEVDADPTTVKLFKALRKGHPALQARGPRAADVTRVLQAFAGTLDALSPIRNQASLAHANLLLEEPEALAVVNAARTIFRYVQDSVKRYDSG